MESKHITRISNLEKELKLLKSKMVMLEKKIGYSVKEMEKPEDTATVFNKLSNFISKKPMSKLKHMSRK